MFIYADHGATTPMSAHAAAAMIPYMQEIYGNPSSLHAVGQAANAALCNARCRAAAQLGCEPREITFTSGGSEADNQAILSVARLGAAQEKKHIISTAFEHHAVLHTLQKLEQQGFEVTLLDVHENGLVTAQQVADAIREDTCLVTVMYANNEIGTVQPIPEIGAVCRENGVLFHTDAVQAVGRVPIDVKAQQIDLLSLSAHKFHGPKGVGLLYAGRNIPLEPLICGGGQERGHRAGTENLAGIQGMVTALEDVISGMAQANARLLPLRDRLIDGLSQIPGALLNGDRLHRLPGNVNFCFEDVEGEALLVLLDSQGICASSGSACASGSLDPSHVLLALGRSRAQALGSLRLTLDEAVTREEVDYLIRAVTQDVARLRRGAPRQKEACPAAVQKP